MTQSLASNVRLQTKYRARMGLLSLHDPQLGKTSLSLITARLMDWILQDVHGPLTAKEPIPEDVYEELAGPNNDPRLRFLVPFSSNRQLDRALLVNGKAFPSMPDVQRYAKRHRIEIYATFDGEMH